MRDYVVMSDSSLDLDQQVVEALDIRIVPYLISMDGKVYKKDREEIPVRDFFEQAAAQPNVYPKTSMPSTGDYAKKMEEAVSDGKDVLCLCMSGKLTSSFQSAENAAALVMDAHPECTIEVLDSMLATVLQGLFVQEAARMQKAGVSLADNIRRLKEIQTTGSIFFTIGSLDYLIHGGRIGKVKGMAARSLHLKPLLLMENGELYPLGVTRTRKSSWKKMVDAFCDHVDTNHLDLNRCIITTGYGLDIKEGEAFHSSLQQTLQEKYGHNTPAGCSQIGAVMCVHIGPYPLGIGIMEKSMPEGKLPDPA